MSVKLVGGLFVIIVVLANKEGVINLKKTDIENFKVTNARSYNNY